MTVTLKTNGSVGAKTLIRKGTVGDYVLNACCCFTCGCSDGTCCWSTDATVSGNWSYDADIYAIKSHYDEELGWVAEVDCSGDDVSSSFLYHVHIDWNYNAVVVVPDSTGDMAGCCKFAKSGYFCSGSGCGGNGCDNYTNLPGATVEITGATFIIDDFLMSLSIALYPNCSCSGNDQWKISAGWSIDCNNPDIMHGGCPLQCVEGDCLGFSEVNCDAPCHEGVMGLWSSNPMGSAWRAYDETSTISGTAVSHCCRDGGCKPGTQIADGSCESEAMAMREFKAVAVKTTPAIKKPCNCGQRQGMKTLAKKIANGHNS